MKAPILAVDGLKVGDLGITGVVLDVRLPCPQPEPEPLDIDRMEYELVVNGNRSGGDRVKGPAAPGLRRGEGGERLDVNFLSLPGVVKYLCARTG